MRKLLKHIIGEVSWVAPSWIKKSNHSKRTWALFIVLIIVVAASLGYWYFQQSSAHLVTAIIKQPKLLSPAEREKKVRSPVVILFKELNKRELASVAPLNLIHNKVTEGISIKPKVEGYWMWQNESTLIFKPQDPWPAGKQYQVTMAKKLIKAPYRIKKQNYTFSTHPVELNIKQFKFYLDLKDPSNHYLIADICSNYPIDLASLQSRLHLTNSLTQNEQPFTLQNDEKRQCIYLKSKVLELTKADQFVELAISPKVAAKKGKPTQKSYRKTARIPSALSYLTIDSVKSNIVRNKENIPSQVLFIKTSLEVNTEELQELLHVGLLPEREKYQLWERIGQLSAEVIAKTNKVKLRALPSDRKFTNLHAFEYAAPSDRQLLVEIDKGLKATDPFILANPYRSIVAVPHLPQEINFKQKGVLLALTGNKRLEINARGLPAVKIKLAKVIPSHLNQLIIRSQGNLASPNFSEYAFDLESLTRAREKIHLLNPVDQQHLQYLSLDLGEYLDKETPQLGLFVISVQGWDPKEKTARGPVQRRLIMLTDLGLMVKDNKNGSHEVFVASFTHNKPIAKAKVSILGRNGVVIYQKMTDEQGHLLVPNLKNFKNEKEPLAYWIQHGSDSSVMPFAAGDRMLNYTRFSVGGYYEAATSSQLKAFIFTERGIYRPGEIIHAGAIVRDDGWGIYKTASVQLRHTPILMELRDPSDKIIFEKNLQLNEEGFFQVDIALDKTAAIGNYSLYLYTIKDKKFPSFLTAYSLRVATFEPESMAINLQLNKKNKGWVHPQHLQGKVSLKTFFDKPAVGNRVTANATLLPGKVYFDEYPEYVFYDPLKDPQKPFHIIKKDPIEQITDDQGQAILELNLAEYADTSFYMNLYVQGYEKVSGQSVSGQINQLVSPLDYMVGIKSEDKLDFLALDKPKSVRYLAINAKLQPVGLKDLQVKIYRREKKAILTEQANGTYQYETTEVNKLLKEFPFEITNSGNSLQLWTKEIGDYQLAVYSNDRIVSSLNYSVVGEDDQSVSHNAELIVHLDKTTYTPGDIATLSIKAPYTGLALVTIERDKVYSYQWLRLTKSHSIFKIKIPHELQGNGYINVAVIRDWNSKEIFTSPLSFAVIPFKLTQDDYALDIDLSLPRTIKSGTDLKIDYSTKQPASIILFGVNKGILSLTDYHYPNPLAYFFAKRSLQVNTLQTIDLILPQWSFINRSAFGGGKQFKASIERHLNPFKKKTAQPIVFWSPILKSTPDKKQYHFQVPSDFNGTLDVMAVAVSKRAMGAVKKEVIVQSDFIISPHTPDFVVPGDEFFVAVEVMNNLAENLSSQPITIKLAQNGSFDLIGKEEYSIHLPPKKSKIITFHLKAKASLGEQTLLFIASAEHYKSQVSSRLVIQPGAPLQSFIASGFSRHKQMLSLEPSLYKEFFNGSVSVSPSPFILTTGLKAAIDTQPYESTRQLLGQILSLSALGNLHSSQELKEMLAKVTARQTTEGGFVEWDWNNKSAEPLTSIFAIDVLTQLYQSPYQFLIKEESFKAGLNFLQNLVQKEIHTLKDAKHQAYAAYILTQNAVITTPYLAKIEAYLQTLTPKYKKDDLISAYIAASYQLLKANKIANKWIETYDIDNHELVDNAQFLVILANLFPDRFAKINTEILYKFLQPVLRKEYNSMAAAYTISALKAYNEIIKQDSNAKFSVTEILADGKENKLIDSSTVHESSPITYSAQKVSINSSSSQGYFYQILRSGYADQPLEKPVYNGIEIYRNYQNEKGESITDVALGDVVNVVIRVRMEDKLQSNDVAIIDLFPAGFQLEKATLPTQNFSYINAQDDKVIFLTTVDKNVKSWSYKLRATTPGKFHVPTLLAESLKNPTIKGLSKSGTIEVREPVS